MLTVHELRQRKQQFRKKSRVSVRPRSDGNSDGKTDRVEETRVLQSTGSVEPPHWNEEVVRALASRMPGGFSTITRECKFCRSVFYPCLCAEGSDAIPHSRAVMAPRVIKEAEARRLLNEPMGNLRELRTTLDLLGMDKDRLHVSGPLEVDDHKVELPVEPYSDCDILWRENDTYVVNPKVPPLEQGIEFTKEELQKLQCVLVERDEYLTVRERWEGRHVKPVSMTYRFAEQAMKDLKFQKVQTAKESYWEVCKVREIPKEVKDLPTEALAEKLQKLEDPKEVGVANVAKIMPGQRLIEIEIALPDPRQLRLIRSETVDLDDIKDLKWDTIKVEDLAEIPNCFSDWDCAAADAGLSFPCRLKIDLVAPGSKVVAFCKKTKDHIEQMLTCKSCKHCSRLLATKGAEATDAASQVAQHPPEATPGKKAEHLPRHQVEVQHVSLDGLDILENPKGADGQDVFCIKFERPPRERISRSEAAVRHRHFTEASVEGWKDDLFLFETWLASKALSPNHLKFVFRKLLESVRKEITEFERKKTHRFQSLLSKSIRWVDLNSRVKEARPENSISLQKRREKDRSKELSVELKVIEQELKFLLDQVPLSFLKDLKDLSHEFARRGDQLSKEDQFSKGAIQMPEPDKSHSRPLRSMRAAPVMRVSSMREVTMMLEENFGQSMPFDERKRLTDAFQHLEDVSDQYEEELRGRGKKHGVAEHHEDGRLSYKEFEREMIKGGVNWLGREELQHLFESMDADGSGKLNLGELQCTAIRLTDLADRVQRFYDENEGMSAENCLLEFGHLLQMGSDLVGSQTRPLIPDCRITASSYHLNHPEHGFGQMWRSRLDSDESCWIASEEEENPWLQWRFPSRREIRAVATKGNPNAKFWVTSFKIRYLEDELEDDETLPADDDRRWQEYKLKGHSVTLEGNFDENSRKDNFLVPFVASCVRICPQDKHGKLYSMRASLYGSFRPPPQTSEQNFELFCKNFEGLLRPPAKSTPPTRLTLKRPKSPDSKLPDSKSADSKSIDSGRRDSQSRS